MKDAFVALATRYTLTALLGLALTPSFALAQAGQGTLEDEVRKLDVRYGQRVVKGNPLTNRMEQITYTSSANTPDVHFKMDQAELYCDKLEIFEASGDARRRLVATASAGKRVILYMYERDTMIICDTFNHDLENQISRLSATDGRQVISYRYSSDGVLKNTTRWIDIVRHEDGGARIANHQGVLEAIQDHRQEGLPAAQQSRLNAFMAEAARQAQARQAAAEATPAAATESGDGMSNIDNFYVRYDQSAFVSVTNAQGEESGALQFQGNIHLVLDEVDMFADRMEILNIGDPENQSITATANPDENVVIFAFDVSPPIMAICDRFVYDPVSGTSRLESEGSRPNVLSYQINPNGLIIKSRGEYIAITREGDRTNYSLGSSQGQTLPDPTRENLTPAILKDHLLFFVEEVGRRAAGQAPRNPTTMPYLEDRFGAGAAARQAASPDPGDALPTPAPPAGQTDRRAPTIQM